MDLLVLLRIYGANDHPLFYELTTRRALPVILFVDWMSQRSPSISFTYKLSLLVSTLVVCGCSSPNHSSNLHPPAIQSGIVISTAAADETRLHSQEFVPVLVQKILSLFLVLIVHTRGHTKGQTEDQWKGKLSSVVCRFPGMSTNGLLGSSFRFILLLVTHF